MHIMHVIDGLGRGGAERVLVDLAHLLHASGAQVSVCVTRSNLEMAAELGPEIPVYCLKRSHRFDWRGAQQLVKLLETHQVDILHVHSRSTFLFVLLARAFAKARPPILLHDHYGWIDLKTGAPLWFRWLGSRSLAAYVGVCANLGQWARQAGVPPEKVRVIDNGLDFRRLHNTAAYNLRNELNLPQATRLGIMTGSIRAQKGLKQLIQAVSKMRQAGRVKFLLVGPPQEADYEKSCRTLMQSQGLADHFVFMGERADMLALCRSVDFGVIPSLSESGPLTLIEYLACGLPVVAAQTGSISLAAANAGIAGFFPPGDIAALAGELDRLLESPPGAWDERRQAGLALAPQFDFIHKLPAWQAVYHQIAQGAH